MRRPFRGIASGGIGARDEQRRGHGIMLTVRT